MAKSTKPAPKKSSSKALAVSTGGVNVPAELASMIKQDSGKGLSTAAEDNLVPLIYVLQANSPQVNQRGQQYIKGAVPGAIWLRSSSTPIISGEEGILFQPCYFEKNYIEWVPRAKGGGLAAVHDAMPKEAVQKSLDKDNPKRKTWVMKNGNEIKETRYEGGLVFEEKTGGWVPYTIPFSSTGNSVAQAWMRTMNSKFLEGIGKAPSWACIYRLKTKYRTNASGEWFAFEVFEAGDDGEVRWATPEEYRRGRALYEAFSSGAKSVEVEESGLRRGDDDDSM